jgi:transcription termination factor Rho
MAEDLEIENAPSMRKGEMMFSILKERAEEGWEVSGDGVMEVLQDGFGFPALTRGELPARAG